MRSIQQHAALVVARCRHTLERRRRHRRRNVAASIRGRPTAARHHRQRQQLAAVRSMLGRLEGLPCRVCAPRLVAGRRCTARDIVVVVAVEHVRGWLRLRGWLRHDVVVFRGRTISVRRRRCRGLLICGASVSTDGARREYVRRGTCTQYSQCSSPS